MDDIATTDQFLTDSFAIQVLFPYFDKLSLSVITLVKFPPINNWFEIYAIALDWLFNLYFCIEYPPKTDQLFVLLFQIATLSAVKFDWISSFIDVKLPPIYILLLS